jgi:hypothetical protein
MTTHVFLSSARAAHPGLTGTSKNGRHIYLALIAVFFSVLQSTASSGSELDQPISCGQTLTGQITAKGQIDSYSFSANSGDKVIVSAHNNSGLLQPVAELYGPSGALIGSSIPGGKSNVLPISASGTHSIRVRDSSLSNTGSYGVSLQFTNGRCGTSISCGETKAGTISTAGQQDAYAFSANSGDRIILSAHNSTGLLAPIAELYDPSGSLVAASAINGKTALLSINSAGMYTVLLHDNTFSYTGNYGLSLQFTNGKCGSSILCGETRTGAINAAGQQDAYAFSANSGDRIILSVHNSTGLLAPLAELYDPSGSLVAASAINGKTALLSINSAGTYTVLVHDNTFSYTGNYGLSLQFTNGKCGTSILCGETRAGAINAAGQQDAYAFSATPGDKIVISAHNRTGLLASIAELYDPSGAFVASTPVNGKSVVLPILSPGTHTILLHDNAFSYTGGYGLSLQFTNNRCGTAIACGETKTADISGSGELDAYTFLASAGDRVLISAHNTTGLLAATANLYDPAGAFVAATPVGGRSEILALASTGTYTILLQDNTLAYSGGYGISLQFANGKCGTAISCGETRPGSIGIAGQQNAYLFTGAAGDIIALTTRATSGLLGAIAELYSPSGVLVGATPSNGKSGSLTLASAGTYAILVHDSSLAYSGNYELNLSCGATACSYTIASPGQSFPASGGSGSLGVTSSSASCTWTGVSNVSWITITSGANGTGNGTVTFTVSSNSDAGTRTGTITVAGKTFTVTQDGTGCSYSVSPTGLSIGAAGGTGAINVSAGSNCSWTAAANASWITLTSGTSGTGNGTVNYSVTANESSGARSGTLMIAGRSVTITQSGKATCSYSLSEGGQAFGSGGGTGTLTVVVPAGCGWTAISSVPWATITSGGSGSGSGTVGYSVSTNPGTDSRTGTLTVGDKIYTITQAGSAGIPFGSTVNVNVSQAQGTILETVVPDHTANLFVVLKKDTSWGSVLDVLKDNAVVKSRATSEDTAIQIRNPVAGRYAVRLAGTGAGSLSILASLPELRLGEWNIGTIQRYWGSAWYQVSVPAGQSVFSVAASTLGLFSQLRLSFGDLDASQYWSASGDKMRLQVDSPAAGTYYVFLRDSAWFSDGLEHPRDHQIRPDLQPITSQPSENPVITSFSPAQGGTSGLVTLKIDGAALDPKAKVRLVRSGAAEINPLSINGRADKRLLVCTFSLAGSVPGSATLVVENPDGRTATGSTAFAIVQVGQAEPWVQIVGRSMIRVGRTATYTIRFGNKGSADAYVVPLWLEVPKPLELTMDTLLAGIPGSTVPAIGPVAVSQDTEPSLAGFVIPYLPAGYSGEFSVSLYTGSALAGIQLRAWTGNPLLTFAGPGLQAIEPDPAKPDLTLAPAPDGADCLLNVLKVVVGLIPGNDCPKAWFKTQQMMVGAGIDTYNLTGSVGNLVAFADLLVSYLKCAGLGAAPPVLIADILLKLNRYIKTVTSCMSLAMKTGAIQFLLDAVTSISPEDKVGPAGYDPAGTVQAQKKRYIPLGKALDYRVDFWNREDAPAPTQDVIITDQLDPDLDWNTFSFGEFGFLKWKVPIEGGQYFKYDVDLRPDKNLIVSVEGTFERSTGAIRWEFHALDPATRRPPDDPMAGFLPPITGSGYEIGWVNFRAMPKGSLATGTRIENQALVKFDLDVFKPAPSAGPFLNTIDAGVPASAVRSLPSDQTCPGISLNWSGSDDAGGSGVKGYSIYVSDNGGAFTPWLLQSTDTSGVYYGQAGHSYAFYSIAEDNVGNREAIPAQPDATTRISGSLTFSSTTLTFASTGGSGTAAVSTSAGCPWSVSSDASWINLVSGASGSGSGNVVFSVAVNTGTSTRTGKLTIGAETLTVTQTGNSASCSFSLSPSSHAFPVGGGNGTTVVSAPAGCAWSAESMVPWITLISGSGGGNGAITFSVAPNSSLISRSTTLFSAGKTITVSQAGAGGSGVLELVYPRLVNRQRDGTGASESTGFAVVNLGSTRASLTMTAYDTEGSLIWGPGIVNPATLNLEPGGQMARLDFEILGPGLLSADRSGWLKLESDSRNLLGFFLTFNDDVSYLDGADVSTTKLTSFLFPEIDAAGFTQIQVVNPNIERANVTLELMDAGGNVRSSISRDVAANGVLRESLAILFPGVAPRSTDYLRGSSTRPVSPLEIFGSSGRYIAALNGRDRLGGATVLYAPQYAVGGRDWATSMSIVNLDSTAGTVTFRLVGDDGSQVGSRTLAIEPRSKLFIDDQKFFFDPGNSLATGYVQITGSGIKLAGSVVFGDPAHAVFLSALPLVAGSARTMYVSQVASDDMYYTGMAILNPGNTDANLVLELFDKAGVLVTSAQERIPSLRRKSQLLTQYFPGLREQQVRGGYIRITSDTGLTAFALYGTRQALSAVPVQVVP